MLTSRFSPPHRSAARSCPRGLADIEVLAEIVPANGFVHGMAPTSIDAGIYGFIANIHFFPIPTPLKAFVDAHRNLAAHCETIHTMVSGS